MRIARLFVLIAALCLTHLDAAGQRTATPEQGEGAWGLLRRNGVSPTAKRVSAFQDVNADKLGKGNNLLRGVRYTIPASLLDGSEDAPVAEPARQIVSVPLFGAAYKDVEVISDELDGCVYYLVAGHGGPDPGTNTIFRGRRLTEDEIAYDVSLRTARALIAMGATVYNIVQDANDGIRDTELLGNDRGERYLGGAAISANPERRLRKRTEIINGLYDKHRRKARLQRVVSLHVDALSSRSQPQIDVHFAYHTPSGRAVGNVLRQTMADQYEAHQPGRGYDGGLHERDLHILRETKPVAVLVELGNIRHRGDQIRLVKAGNRQALADWIAEGLAREARGSAL